MNADPKGLTFFDKASGRTMRLVHERGPYCGWLIYKHPDGQWVSLREATREDRNALLREQAESIKAYYDTPESDLWA